MGIADYFGFTQRLLWACIGILIVHRSLKDKVCGIPLLSACLFFSWEVNILFFHPVNFVGYLFEFIYLPLDICILAIYLLYGRKNFPAPERTYIFYGNFLLILISSFVLTCFAVTTPLSAAVSANGETMINAILFLEMLFRRNSSAGQSLYIGILKTIATCCAATEMFILGTDPMFNFVKSIVIVNIIFDLLYCVFLYQFQVKEGKDPWRNF